MASSTTRTRPIRAAWTASGACTSGSTGRREGETRRAAPTTRSTGSAVTTSTTTQTGPANNQTRVVGPAAYNHPDHPYLAVTFRDSLVVTGSRYDSVGGWI